MLIIFRVDTPRGVAQKIVQIGVVEDIGTPLFNLFQSSSVWYIHVTWETYVRAPPPLLIPLRLVS